MTTPRDLTSSLHEAFKKSFVNSDISFNQVLFWVTLYINKANTINAGKSDSGLYTVIFPEVPVEISAVNVTPNFLKNQKYVELPTGILELVNDGGIQIVTYANSFTACQPTYTNIKFTRTTLQQAERLYWTPDEKPSPANPYFLRSNVKYLWFLGIENIQCNKIFLALRLSFNPLNDIGCSLDDPLPFDEGIIADLYKQVLEVGRFVMLVNNDLTNTGKDNNAPETAPKGRVVSLNESPNQQQQTE